VFGEEALGAVQELFSGGGSSHGRNRNLSFDNIK
jgi:hypothetical protein